jgi:hypothetical protein
VREVGLVEYVGRFDPVGYHCEGFSSNKQSKRFLFARYDLVGTTIRRLQSEARGVLTD